MGINNPFGNGLYHHIPPIYGDWGGWFIINLTTLQKLFLPPEYIGSMVQVMDFDPVNPCGTAHVAQMDLSEGWAEGEGKGHLRHQTYHF